MNRLKYVLAVTNPAWTFPAKRAHLRLAFMVVVVVFFSAVRPDGATGQEPPGEILVTSSSGEVNGDTSSVEALQANPGDDGISLPEAIAATNNDPGTYLIKFATALAGATIAVHYFFPIHEPLVLTGGGVSIDGDIDGNGFPDITVTSNTAAGTACSERPTNGFVIASGGNRLHGLVVSGVRNAVVVRSPAAATGQTILGPEITNLALSGCQSAITYGSPGQSCASDTCATNMRWVDTKITGNTIESGFAGISVMPTGLAGDHLDRLTISDNTIQIDNVDMPAGGMGIAVTSETAAITGGNRVSDVVITGNTVTGNPDGGIHLNSGGTASTVERIKITGNRIDIGPPVWNDASCPNCSLTAVLRTGIFIQAGDTEPSEGIYASQNVLSDVLVSDNVLRGGQGVIVHAGCCGASHDLVQDVRILRNRIRASGPDWDGLGGIWLEGGHGWIQEEPPPTRMNRIHNVSIRGNRIVIDSTKIKAAMWVTGAWGRATRNKVTCVHLRRNRVIGIKRALLVRDNIGGAWGNTARLGGC